MTGKRSGEGSAREGERGLRLLPLAVLVLLGALLWFGLGLDRFVDLDFLQENRESLLRFVQAHRLMAAAAFIVLYGLAVALSLPIGALMTLTGGFLFGTLAASIYVVVGATLGATAVFLAARSAFGAILRARTGGALERMREGFSRNAFSYLLVLRLVPLFPFWLVNLVPACLGVPLRIYVLATAIGIIPGTFVYASAGNGLGAVLEAGGRPDLGLIFQPEILTPLLGLALLSLLPVAYRWWKGWRGGNGAKGRQDGSTGG